MNKSLEELRIELTKRRGTITRIAKVYGISYSWLMQFAHGKITNPTVNRINQLCAALEMMPGEGLDGFVPSVPPAPDLNRRRVTDPRRRATDAHVV